MTTSDLVESIVSNSEARSDVLKTECQTFEFGTAVILTLRPGTQLEAKAIRALIETLSAQSEIDRVWIHAGGQSTPTG